MIERAEHSEIALGESVDTCYTVENDEFSEKNWYEEYPVYLPRQLNTTRVSNFFIETRVVSYTESLASQGFPLFLHMFLYITKHQNCEDVFIRQHRGMNTTFRYIYRRENGQFDVCERR